MLTILPLQLIWAVLPSNVSSCDRGGTHRTATVSGGPQVVTSPTLAREMLDQFKQAPLSCWYWFGILEYILSWANGIEIPHNYIHLGQQVVIFEVNDSLSTFMKLLWAEGKWKTSVAERGGNN